MSEDCYTGTWVKCACCGGSGYHGSKNCCCVSGKVWVDSGTAKQQEEERQSKKCSYVDEEDG